MNTYEDEIAFRLKRIISDRLGEDANKLLNGKQDINILSYSELGARDLVYLYFDIEKEFNIRIKEKYVLAGCFHTLDGIVAMIKESIKE